MVEIVSPAKPPPNDPFQLFLFVYWSRLGSLLYLRGGASGKPLPLDNTVVGCLHLSFIFFSLNCPS